MAAVAKTVSESEASYQLYKTQCIWYALTIFNLVAQEFHEEGSPVVFVGKTEPTVRKLMKESDLNHLSRVFGQSLQVALASTSYPFSSSSAGARSCTILPSTESPGGMQLITALFPANSAKNRD